MKKKCIFILQFLLLMNINVKSAFASIKILPDEISLGINYSQNLKISNASSNNITWTSSNPDIVSVDNGKITGINTGEAYIKVSDGLAIALCKVKIIDNYVGVASISLAKSEETLLLNDTIKLTPTILPINASNKIPIYVSSSPDIVSVTPSGYITAKKVGSANISITIEDKALIYKINVVDKITLEDIKTQSSVMLKQNGTARLSVTYIPENATDKTVTWKSSNPSIVTVDTNGNVKGVSPGTATITVISNDGSHVATSKITVTANNTTKKVENNDVTTTKNQNTTNNTNIKLISISLNKTTLSLNVNEEQTLSVIYNPNNATDKEVTWKSNNPEIVTVNNLGKIKAISPGTAIVTVTSNDGKYEAKCNITVLKTDTDNQNNEKKLISIKLSEEKLKLKKGQDAKLEVIYNPNDTINKEVIWSSSNEEIVTVNNGIVTAVSPGTATINVKSIDGDIEAKCNVTVYSDLPIESIKFEKERQIVYVGSTINLTTIATPENTMIDNPIWSSSDEYVATIEDGTVTALNVGTTTITLSDEKNEISASIIVNVIEKPADKLQITIEGYDLNFNPNIKNYTLTIGSETTLNIKTNYDQSKVAIGGNRDLKNGSIITVTVNDNNNTKTTYVINIKKKGFSIIYFIAIISVLLILNIIRLLINNKKKK